MRIIDLKADDSTHVAQAAQLLYEGFRVHWPDAWPNFQAAKEEVMSCCTEVGRVCRAAVEEGTGRLVGFIGGIPLYGGKVWEIHPLVVAEDLRKQGIGRALVEDLEAQVARKGGFTLWVGSDDESGMTSLFGVDLYPDPLEHLRTIRNVAGHPFEFYRKLGFAVSGVLPDANGPGKPDIFLAKRVGSGGSGK